MFGNLLRECGVLNSLSQTAQDDLANIITLLLGITISFSMNNVKLDKILNEIENQPDYLFIYNNQVDINKITSVKVKNEAVAQVLDRILSGTGINYELEGTHIILTTEAIKDLHAQQQAKTVTGTVTDVSGEPIIGANIRIKGTTTGTITDIDGNFSIEA